MESKRFVRLTDPGRDALEIWPPIEARHVASGTPEQRGHMLLDDAETGASAGIWHCTAWTGTMGPYSVHEFMILLEGSVTIVEGDGRQTTIHAGESFVIPKGLVCAWMQTGPVRKFFTIFDDKTGAIPPAHQRVIKLDRSVPLAPAAGPDPSLVISANQPQWQEAIVNADTTGQWNVGLWSTTPYQRKVIPFPRHEMMHFLEGEVTLSHGDGTEEVFRAGDAVFVPQGAPLGWRNTVPVKKIYSIMQPAQ